MIYTIVILFPCFQPASQLPNQTNQKKKTMALICEAKKKKKRKKTGKLGYLLYLFAV
jgi:uracil-DNA glycosylase